MTGISFNFCGASSLVGVGLVSFMMCMSADSCSWPPEFASSTWIDSSKGALVFDTTEMTGWSFNVENLQISDWECYNTDYYDTDGYLIMKTLETFILHHERHFYGFLCMKLTKVTDVSYRYYEVMPVQANINYERLLVNDVDIAIPTDLSGLCLTDYGAHGSEYKILLKAGQEDKAKVRCPYSFLGDFDYTHTSVDGTVTCQSSTDIMSLCINNKEITFSYDTCPTKVAYSAADTVWCVDSVPVDDNYYVMVYNVNDGSVDDIDTYRFSCFGVSADTRHASVTPQNCKKDQTPFTTPVDNSNVTIGSTLDMIGEANFCPPCLRLESPPKGDVSITTNGANTIAQYTCVNNYTISGDSTRICQENNTWSGTTPSCTCETPTSPTNGAVTLSADGTTATYTCIANFTLDGDRTRTCQTNTNTWSGSEPRCAPCDTLEELIAGEVSVLLTSSDTVSEAHYTCDAGATLNGDSSRTCQSSGLWTGTKPSCTSCPALNMSTSGSVNLTTDGTVTSANLVCPTGYSLTGQKTLRCQTNGTWDAAKPQCLCNSPPEPQHGHLTVQDDNTASIYTCDPGYTIDGPSLRTCQSDGTGWTGMDPVCAACINLTSTEGLLISISTNGSVTSSLFACDLNYTMRGYSSVPCQANGLWEFSQPICEKCTALSAPESGTLSFTTNGTQTIAEFKCKTGTTLRGEPETKCRDSGIWTSAAASCVSCGSPDGLLDGSYIMSTNGTTSVVTYSCASGYTLTGSSQSYCSENGAWIHKTAPLCSQNNDVEPVVTEQGSTLLPVVVVLAVLSALLAATAVIATYCYCKLKKAGQTKGYSTGNDDIPKSIPIAAVPPSAAPIDHQQPLFDSGRATALSMAPDAHRHNSSRNLYSANSRSTTASITRLNLELIRETTESSVYGSGFPAPWSSKESTASGSTDLPRLNSPTLSSLYSSYSSPRRGYTQTPRYSDDNDDTTRASPMTDDNVYRETPSPRKSAKKRKKSLRQLSHADLDENDVVPSYMKGTKSSTSKTFQDMMLNDNKQSSRTALTVFGNDRELSTNKRPPPKLTSPRV